jgi:hypothetical protein
MTTREHDETRSMREGEDRQRQALDETKHATKRPSSSRSSVSSSL